MPDRKLLYAHMDKFPTNWNDEGASVMLGVRGETILAVGWFGSIKLNMNDPVGIADCLAQTRAFADAVEEKYKEYLNREQITHGHADRAEEEQTSSHG